MFSLPAFYPILDTGVAARRGRGPVDAALVDITGEMLDAGVSILQLRHKGFVSREILEAAERIAQLCRERGVLFVMNDRADIARLTGAALHLGQDDLAPTAARKVTGPETVIGFSTHNEAQLRALAAEPVDYVALGPIFGTATKENPDPTVGLDELRRLRPLTKRPLVAIGGITRENARAVLDAGADSVAVIGDLIPESGTLRERVAEWLAVTSYTRP